MSHDHAKGRLQQRKNCASCSTQVTWNVRPVRPVLPVRPVRLATMMTMATMRNLEVVRKQVGGYMTRCERIAASISLNDES